MSIKVRYRVGVGSRGRVLGLESSQELGQVGDSISSQGRELGSGLEHRVGSQFRLEVMSPWSIFGN